MTAGRGAWLAVAAWAALIFLLSARPSLPVDLGGGLDKVAHFGAYLVLGLLLAWAHGGSRARLAQALVLGLAYAASDEFHQSFVPGRSADVGDWVADALGVATGVLLWSLRST